MKDEELDQMLNESDEIIQHMKQQEEIGLRDVLRYFDRIHDKLFSFNNLLIAGYFILIAAPQTKTSPWWMLLPIFNMLILIYVDYEMMEKSRFESAIMSKTPGEIEKYGKEINKTTNRSLSTIIFTIFVTIIFIIQLLIFV